MPTSNTMLETKLSRATTRWILDKFTYNGSDSNGYFRVSLDGYMEQWGRVSSGNGRVTFPKSYDIENSVNVQITSTDNNHLILAISNISRTGFDVQAHRIDNEHYPIRFIEVNSFSFIWKACGYIQKPKNE